MRAAAAPARVSVKRHDADAVEPLQPQHAAGALGHCRGLAFGARTSAAASAASCASRPLACLANRVCGERVDADDLAAKRHRVEIRLEDLALLPASPRAGSRSPAWPSFWATLRPPAGAPGRRRAGRRAASSASMRRACCVFEQVAPGAAPPRPSRRRCAPRSAGPRSGRSPCSSAGEISASGTQARRRTSLSTRTRLDRRRRGDRAG